MSEFRVLISDALPPTAREMLEATGKIEVFEGQDRMEELLPTIHGWIVRSGTRVTAELLEQAPQLRCVCRAGAGVDNVDLDAATRHGVVVMNTPGSNSQAAAEHTVALLLSLARNIPFAHATMASGGWGRKNYVGIEVEGKTLGVLGLGKVGRIVVRKARGLGMNVVGYDPFVSSEVASELGFELDDLDGVLARSDFLALHTPLTEATRGLISTESLAKCRPGVRIVNCSRGGVVDEDALLEAIEKGTVAGAALDVFSAEPPPEDSPLRNHPRIVLTPHLGASTVEAQAQVAEASARQVRDHLIGGTVVNAVNAVSIPGAERQRLAPYAQLAERLGSFQAQILDAQPKSIRIEVEGQEAGDLLERLVTDHALVGFIGKTSDTPVNVVNARLLARERGIDVTVKSCVSPGSWTRGLRVHVTANGHVRKAEGAVVAQDSLRLVRFDEYSVDGLLEGSFVITMSEDRPGMVGRLGCILGDENLNIAGLSLGRSDQGGTAMAIFNLDTPASSTTLDKLMDCSGVTRAFSITV